MEKKCSKCGNSKPLEQFIRDASKASKRRSSCKECDTASRKCKRNYHIQRRYNLTPEEYAEKLESQGGICCICKRDTSTFSRTGHLQVDHCHKTGQIRKLLCGQCNTFVGRLEVYQESGLLKNFLEYLAYCQDLHARQT